MKPLPKSSLGQAVTYAAKRWDGLEKFLDNPRVPLDNNRTEREIRPVAVGRKNHYGSKTENGTKVAGLFYSLIHSAKLSGLDPWEYLKETSERAIAAPGTVTLPKDLK